MRAAITEQDVIRCRNQLKKTRFWKIRSPDYRWGDPYQEYDDIGYTCINGAFHFWYIPINHGSIWGNTMTDFYETQKSRVCFKCLDKFYKDQCAKCFIVSCKCNIPKYKIK